MLTLIILRCLQAGLKCSNSFDKRKKADQSPQPSLFTTSFFCRGSGFYSAIFSRTCRLETFIALISSLSLSSPSFLPAHTIVHGWLQWLHSHKSTFITVCPPIGVASVVAIGLLIRIIWGGTTHHCSLFWEFIQE